MSQWRYSGNPGHDVSTPDLDQPFAPYGTAENVQVIEDCPIGRSAGFGFVETGSAAGAQAAIAARNGSSEWPPAHGRRCPAASSTRRRARRIGWWWRLW